MSTNNADFEISEVFNVKGKIALVTVYTQDPGGIRRTTNNRNREEALALA